MVASIDWNHFKPIYEAKRKRPLIEQMEVEEGQQAQPEHTFVEQLLSLPVGQRYDRLKAHLRDQVAKVLGFGASDKLDPQQGFFTIGMDSVMAVQLRVLLEASLGQTLPSTIAFEYPTIEMLTTYLANDVLKLKELTSAFPVDDSKAVGKAETQKTLSEDELLSMLDDELTAFNKLADGD
jgi:acyl carrier protein